MKGYLGIVQELGIPRDRLRYGRRHLDLKVFDVAAVLKWPHDRVWSWTRAMLAESRSQLLVKERELGDWLKARVGQEAGGALVPHETRFRNTRCAGFTAPTIDRASSA